MSANVSTALDGHFKMAKGKHPGVYTYKGVKIDTRTCTLNKAQEVVNLGWKGLVAVELKKEPKKESKKD